MDWEILFVLTLLIGALVSFILEKIPTDLTAIAVFGALVTAIAVTGSDKLPTIDALLSVFANPAPLTIAVMFILSATLERSGIIDILAAGLGKTTALGYHGFLFVMLVTVGITSAFINNTPVVVVLLPVVLSFAKKLDVPASKLLIPLSFASIIGGVCTTIGTSTNILVSGLIAENGMPEIAMFELAQIGLPLMVVSFAYIMLFSKRILPVRETLTSILSEEERKEYITEAFIKEGSELIGEKIGTSKLGKAKGVRLIEVVRYGVAVYGNAKEIVLQEGDRLVLACRAKNILQTRDMLDGAEFTGDTAEALAAKQKTKAPFEGVTEDDIQPITAHEGAIVEGIVNPKAPLIGRTLRELNFRQRYRMVVIALHRRGRNVKEKLDSLPLEAGDNLLMMGTDSAIENLRIDESIMLLDRPHVPAQALHRKRPLILLVLAGIIGTVSFGLTSIIAAALIGLTVLMVTGCIKPKAAYAAVDWRILMLIYGMLGLGLAMESSGLTAIIASGMAGIALALPPYMQAYGMLALVFIVTSVLTETLSNNATVVLMVPLALSLAAQMGIDARPLVVATCVAASASFATPIGYQTNTYVYGAGGYKFGDFLRIGMPLNGLYFVVSVIGIPMIWSF